MHYLLVANVVAMTFFLVASVIYIKKYKKVLKQKNNTIFANYKIINDLSEQLNTSTRRVVELEDGIENSYGVSVRQVVTNVVADFTKLEMVVLIAAMNKLLQTSKSIADSEFYIALAKKIQKFIDDMKEEPSQNKE